MILHTSIISYSIDYPISFEKTWLTQEGFLDQLQGLRSSYAITRDFTN
jgi:hypothetical protein